MEPGFLFRWLDMGQLELLRQATAELAASLDDHEGWQEFWSRLNVLVVVEQSQRDDQIEALAETN